MIGSTTAKDCKELYFKTRAEEAPVQAAHEAAEKMKMAVLKGVDEVTYHVDGKFNIEQKILFQQAVEWLGFRWDEVRERSDRKNYVYNIRLW